MEDFTSANIAVSDEKREEELEKVKRGKVDYSKLEAEVQEAKSNALEVSELYICVGCPSMFAQLDQSCLSGGNQSITPCRPVNRGPVAVVLAF